MKDNQKTTTLGWNSSNIQLKIVERRTIVNPSTQIHKNEIAWPCNGTSMKLCGVKLSLYRCENYDHYTMEAFCC